jgi:hypothetical protein
MSYASVPDHPAERLTKCRRKLMEHVQRRERRLKANGKIDFIGDEALTRVEYSALTPT